ELASSSQLPARKPRHDGWTVDRQDAFLKALASSGCVAHAARSVGMSRQSAHNLYNHPRAADFRRAWEAALDCSLRLVEDGAWSRSIHGVPRPIFFQGEQVGEYRHYDERLTMFLLRYRRAHRYAEVPKLAPLVSMPGLVDDEPDPDEAIAALDYYRDDLVDETELPGGEGAGAATIDGVNFVNLTPTSAPDSPDQPHDEPPEQQPESLPE
ncbi:MAG: hypothetical protein ABIW33_04345, partial [Sphingomicrobium sp.]